MPLWEFFNETNDVEDSKKEIKLEVIRFEQLWDNYPSSSPKHSDGNKSDIFSDHCAINISHMFLSLDIKMKSFKGKRCYGKCSYTKQHALVAQELANWLKLKPFPGCPTPEKYSGANFEEKVSGRTGIIFFKDYWARNPDNPSIRIGDHIDLWKENTLASARYSTPLRLTFPSLFEHLGMSDLAKSTEVLFWEIK